MVIKPNSKHNDHPWIKAVAEAPVAASSRTVYVSNLNNLVNVCGYDAPEQLLQDHVGTWKTVCRTWPSKCTRKAYCASLSTIFRYNDGLETRYPEARAYFSAKLKKLNGALSKASGSGRLTEREKLSFLPWTDVLKKLDELVATQEPGSVSAPLLLLACYTLIPPLRQDWGNVRVFSHNAPPTEDQMKTINYLLIGPKSSGCLTLNVYKTAAKTGPLVKQLPRSLVKLIKLSFRSDPRKYVFERSNGSPYTGFSFNGWSNAILKTLFAPRPVTVTTLRHSFISSLDYNELSANELGEIARNMGHSVNLQLHYRRKPEQATPDAAPAPEPSPAPSATRAPAQAQAPASVPETGEARVVII